jgi:histidyl-tRNA synthetase
MPDKKNLTVPKTLPGFMELYPDKQTVFNGVMDIIRKGFESYGFLPLDTPVLEYSEVLLAKAGGETEKQIYRFSKGDTDLCMRFDLTVPLAKFVASNAGALCFPFRRDQIGQVYRGERPQKGRFREFYQCDIDIIGENTLSILCDAEIPAVIYSVFRALGFDKFKILISNRKILKGFLNSLGLGGKTQELTAVIDKLKKTGAGKTADGLLDLGLSKTQTEKILRFLVKPETKEEHLLDLFKMKEELSDSDFSDGVGELDSVLKNLKLFGVKEEFFDIDLSIVRGLDYYTGSVYETFLEGHENIGSVCSGGRYDNLAGFYTDKTLPGVGISIGLTRLFDKLSDYFCKNASGLASVLAVAPDDNVSFAIAAAARLRESGINCTSYLENAKMKAKFRYAERQSIPFLAIAGETEFETGSVTLKHLATGRQWDAVSFDEAVKIIKELK